MFHPFLPHSAERTDRGDAREISSFPIGNILSILSVELSRVNENENAAIEKVIGNNGGDENDDEEIKELV